MQQITYTMLFRRLIGLSMDARVWDVAVFTRNRERLLGGNIAVEFLLAAIGDPAVKRQLSDEHFSVDGTVIDAWASMKSFRRKDGSDDDPSGSGRNAERDFRGDKRSNETHASITDPDARLYRKSNRQPSRFCYMGHRRIENRNGLIVDARTTDATGRAEREAAEAMVAAAAPGRRVTLGADKADDAAEHVANLRAIGVTPGERVQAAAFQGRGDPVGIARVFGLSLSHRDLSAMLADRGVAVDHTTLFRWLQAFAATLEQRVRRHLRPCAGSWRVDETYIKVKGVWTYLYRAVDSLGQTIDFLLSARRDTGAAKRVFCKALAQPHTVNPRTITVDKNPAYPRAAMEMKRDGQLWRFTRLRPCKYLTDVFDKLFWRIGDIFFPARVTAWPRAGLGMEACHAA